MRARQDAPPLIELSSATHERAQAGGVEERDGGKVDHDVADIAAGSGFEGAVKDGDGRDVDDLEAFLGSLTGAVVPEELRTDTHVVLPAKCALPNDTVGEVCGATCVPVGTCPS